MIALTHLDGTRMVLNADLVEKVETIPDTVITLTSGKRILVREEMQVIVDKVMAFKRSSQEHGRFLEGER